MYTEILNIGL